MTPTTPRLRRRWGRVGAALSVLGIAALGACAEILDLPERRGATRIVSCEGGECTCVDGFQDCDDDLSNGCEAPRLDPTNCTRCGLDCLGGVCGDAGCSELDILIRQGAILHGPVLQGDRLVVADFASNTVFAGPKTALTFDEVGVFVDDLIDIAKGPDGVFVAHAPFDDNPEVTITRVDESALTEIMRVTVPTPFSTITADFAVTTDAFWLMTRVLDGDTTFDVVRIDRVNGTVTRRPDIAQVAIFAVYQDQPVWVNDTEVVTDRKDFELESLFQAEVPGESATVSDELLLFDTDDDRLVIVDRATNNVLDVIDVEPTDMTIGPDGVPYWIDSADQGVKGWFDGEVRTLAFGLQLDGQPLPVITRDEIGLFWGDKTEVTRLAL